VNICREGSVLTISIRNLSKVKLSLRAGSEEGNYNYTPDSVPFDFIYGVGSSGFCALESALYEKYEGETITVTVPDGGASETFGHLHIPVLCALGLQKSAELRFLEVTVTGVSEVDSRELVQSIARGLSHGCGGDSCDCGCC